MSQPELESIGASWDRHHAEGSFQTHHAFDDVISFIYRHRNRVRPQGERVRVLDLGCGSGNNLTFLAELGLDAVGIDISATAVERARRLGRERQLRFEVTQGSITELPFEDRSFDLIVDRKSITVLPPRQGMDAIREVGRVLRPGGAFLFTPMSDQDSRFVAGPDHEGFVAGDEAFEQRSGFAFRGYGFWNLGLIRKAFAVGWQLESVQHSVHTSMLESERSQVCEWRVIAKRR